MILTDLQKKMLSMLEELDEYLDEHDITYMLYSGSQLGADRHHGFIPWDDDVDLMMSLENYDRFIEAVRKDLPEGRIVNAMELSDDYPFCYARYVDETTSALQSFTVFGGIDPGAKIDIFFYVPTHSNEKKAQEHQMEILAFNELLSDNINMIYRRPEEFFPVYEKEKKLYERLGRKRYIAKRLPQLKYKYAKKRYGQKKYICFSGILVNSRVFDAEEIANTRTVDFNGLKLKAAANGPYYNLECYGESWYQIPPDVAVPHHRWGLDLDHPYREYLRKLREHFDLPGVLEAMKIQKACMLEEQKLFYDAFVEMADIRNLAVAMSVEKRYREHRGNDQSLAGLYEIFEPFYERQLYRDNRWYRRSLPLAPETMSAALLCLASMGEFARVLEITDITGRDFPKAEKILQMAADSKKLIYAIHVFPSQLRNLTAEDLVQGDIPNLSIEEAKGRMLLERMRRESKASDRVAAARSILSLVSDTVSTFGNRSEMMILQAFALQELEQQGLSDGSASSQECFKDIALHVNNGYIVQELYDQGIDMLYERSLKEENLKDEEVRPYELIHHYVTEEDYCKKKEELEAQTDQNPQQTLRIRERDGEEYMVLYDRSILASNIKGIIEQKKNTTCARTFWHICQSEDVRTEGQEVTLYADNITPAEFIVRAGDEGLLSEEKIRCYNEYRAWRKTHRGDADRIVRQYKDDFQAYMKEEKITDNQRNHE